MHSLRCVNTCNNVFYMYKTEWILVGSHSCSLNCVWHYYSKYWIGILPLVLWSPYRGIMTPYPWYIEPPIHGIFNYLPMVCWPPFPWYFDTISMTIWTPYPWYVELSTHGILTHQPITYRSHIHGLLNPLPMVVLPLYTWYLIAQSLVILLSEILAMTKRITWLFTCHPSHHWIFCLTRNMMTFLVYIE